MHKDIWQRLEDLTALYTQSDLQINQWINEAIADYGMYFPQLKTASITAVAGTHEYSLPSDFVSIVRVEWPVGRESEIVYQASQDSLDDDGAVTTVPDRHLDLVVLFCRWASLQELASEEAANPDPSQLNIRVLDTNAGRAERTYRKSKDDFLPAEKSSQQVSWRMERDRIY